MAYRRTSRSGGRGYTSRGRSTARRAPARRAPARRTARTSRSRVGRAQEVRIVIEQARESPVSRQPFALAQKLNPPAKKARL